MADHGIDENDDIRRQLDDFGGFRTFEGTRCEKRPYGPSLGTEMGKGLDELVEYVEMARSDVRFLAGIVRQMHEELVALKAEVARTRGGGE